MATRRLSHHLTGSLLLTGALSLFAVASGAGCIDTAALDDREIGQAQSAITEVAHTPVERQSIGNCWLYATATWVESLNLAYLESQPAGGGGGGTYTCEHLLCEEGATLQDGCMPAGTEHATCLARICQEDRYCCETAWDGVCAKHVAEGGKCAAELCAAPATGGGDVEPAEPLDVSQSYWTYWHWFGQLTGYMWKDEISTGGSTWTAHGIIRDRGLMKEGDFVTEDTLGEMSQRQSSALERVNAALKSGELSTAEARRDRALVRKVLDDAWALPDPVRALLDQVFGPDGALTLRSGATVAGTQIIDPATLPVRYAALAGGQAQHKEAKLLDAMGDWRTIDYPSDASSRRKTLIRVQRALHAQQPVGITWNVDFNALENVATERRGSFNLQTLQEAGGPGRQGGHMTVLHDYEAATAAHGVLKAGVTLDPEVPEDAVKLAAALEPETQITLLRTKNSWGAARADRAFAPGFPGYHDLWMDYLDGPIKWCPDTENPDDDNCLDERQALREMLMPPGF